MLRGDHLQQIPLIAAAVQVMSPLTAVDQIILRLLHLQGIHIVPGVDLPRIEQELVGGDGEQRLGHLPDVGDQKILDVLGGQHHGGILFPYPLHIVANILNSHRAVQEQVQLVQRGHTVSHAQKLVGHVGKDVELNGAAQLLVQIHNALNAEHQEHIVLDIGVAVEEPALRAHAHRIEAKADITQGLLGVEGLPFRIIAMVFLNTQLIQVGQNGVILRM